MPKIAPTADPDISEVERLFHGGEPNNKTRPADIKQVIMILRSEIARLKDCARVNEERQAKNQDTAQKNYEGWRAEIIRVQALGKKCKQLRDGL
jgi:hypothetical protein